MNLILAGLNEFQISCYIDDLVIAAGNFDEHLAKLEMVFQRLQKANLKVKPSKCSFLKDQITYLSHTVREGQVYPDKKNLDSIREARNNRLQFTGNHCALTLDFDYLSGLT
ncbi:hypothetical protein AVEN_143176-1 [Araneus ventricosus]|uniref:Reverse transcriptase domain-containing protein n=1 Tax=Araneus ventricosus TaxID=182803 RepID=A0A4Y2JVL0_ARAVE|nr:hypothetical protein AVEN_143176-1 [Araneus ventricosus]